MMHCDGKCQMLKKIKKQEGESNTNAPAPKFNQQELILSSKSFYPTIEIFRTQENKFYSNGGNVNSFNGQEFINLSYRIKNGSFESKNPEEIVNLGKIASDKCYNYISEKYSFKQQSKIKKICM